MEHLHLQNTLTRQKEKFEPINPPFVGLYVCGPTVYSESHLGHGRSAVIFDILYRYLRFLDYRVRFVRNVTDVGHLEDDEAEIGDDKMMKKARAMNLEPMEVAQKYLNLYHDDLARLNCLRPNIEPLASGHIPEQIEMVEKLIENGYAYECQGNVFFDTLAYDKVFGYGKLSGRNMEELLAGSRELEGQEGKRSPSDFALWKKAPDGHLMRWKSPWSVGFPGWHLECTVMSTKYLGTKYDIHGGGLDLQFPHHEAEICQSNGCINDPHSHLLDEAKYWIHHNMITIDGTKMSKSKGNFISMEQLWTGEHPRLSQAYAPAVIRFNILQSHYSSVSDFSDKALKASETAFHRLSDAYHRLQVIDPGAYSSVMVNEEYEENLATFDRDARSFMNDDLNTARALARMFDAIAPINYADANKTKPFPVNPETFLVFRDHFNAFFTEVLGLVPLDPAESGGALTDSLMQMVIGLRQAARKEKNFAMADMIRDSLAAIDIKLKDTPAGTEWYVEN
ncbi:MAG: cysteine--tRNA ligase [Bacteroidota bacterium]